MLFKNKLIILTLMLNSFFYTTSQALNRANSELIVSGEDMLERVDYSLSSCPEDVDHKTDNGDVPMKHTIWADGGSQVHNIGNIYTKRQNYDTQAGGVLFGWPNNALNKQDDMIVLRGKRDGLGNLTETVFTNDGLVDMGITYHKIDIVLDVLDLVFYKEYSNYIKNVINSVDSKIINNGTIQSQGDRLYFRTDVQVGLLQWNNTDYKKNIVLMDGGELENTGIVQAERDRNAEVVSIVGVGLLNLGLHYNREVSAINSVDSTIVNNVGGKIFVGGDLLEKRDYNGINLDVIGADFVGNHYKYGVKANGGTVINSGLIEVERDYAKALDEHNNILDLYLIYGSILELGLLSFKNMNESSIGVYLENGGEFYNNGGTITVGANNQQHALQLLDSSAIGVVAKDSNVYFNAKKDETTGLLTSTGETSIINLEGKSSYATSLWGNSNVIFDGITEINYVVPKGIEESKKDEYLQGVNKEIFHCDENATGGHFVKGIVKVNGDLDITNASNVTVEAGGKIEANNPPWGKIQSTGQIKLDGDVKIATNNLIGLSDKKLEDFENSSVLTADKGIIGAGNLKSDSYLFDIESNKNNRKDIVNDLIITDITRKNFNTIVENKELGNILENSYENTDGKALEFYKYIAQGYDHKSFNQRLNEITGIDNVTTLMAQTFDISKDLNLQYRDFIKSNTDEGVVFSYINSKSEIGEKGKYQGFERKSNGIMTGYNKFLSDKQRVGLGFSYMDSSIDYSSNSSNDIKTWNFKAYSDYSFEKFNILNDISFGYNNSENKRVVSGATNEGEIDIYTCSIDSLIYKNYDINDKLRVSPNFNFEVLYAHQDKYDEKGEISPIMADKNRGIYSNIDLGMDFDYEIFSKDKVKVSLVGGLKYSYDIYQDIEDMDILIKDITDNQKIKEKSRELDKESFVCKVGANLNYDEVYNIGLDYSKEMINDVDNDKIGLSFSYRF